MKNNTGLDNFYVKLQLHFSVPNETHFGLDTLY